MKKFNKIDWIMIILSILTIIVTLVVYPSLPAKIPTHWNYEGVIDGYSSKSMALITMCLPLVFYYGINLFRYIDPKRENYKKYEKTYLIIRIVITIMFIVLHGVSLIAAFGTQIQFQRIIPLVVGVLFIVLGNYMGRIKQNYFVGIKTPWTLANEVVWNKTHRIGGYVFVASGILYLFNALFVNTVYSLVIFIIMSIGMIYVVLYSYLLFKKISSEN